MVASFEWEQAKRVLIKLIVKGDITDSMGPRDVYDLHDHRAVFHLVKYERFRDNLNRLRKTLREQAAKASSDELAFVHDRKLYPIDQEKLRWPGSEAEKALRVDVKAGKHKTSKPKELRQTNDEYKKWPLDRFRNHIYQEQMREITSPYWKRISEEKQKKKDARWKNKSEKAAAEKAAVEKAATASAAKNDE